MSQYKLKVKVNRDDDTRLWRYSSMDDFDGLRSFISTTWNLTQFIAQYEDEEGDLITIANAEDLRDAVQFAIDDKKKSLKVFVLHQNNVKTKASSEEAQKNDGEEEAAKPVPSQFASVQEMVVDFLRNAQILLLLPELFGVIISTLIERDAQLEVDEIVEIIMNTTKNEKFEAVTSHPLYVKYSNLVIPYVANRISGQQALYKHFKIGTIKMWIKQLTVMLLQTMANNESMSFKDLVIDIEYPAMTDTGKVIHFGVECDLCGQYPIIGDRYKCSMCPDWDCCPECEPKHDHPLIKFKKSSKQHQNASFKGLSEIVGRLKESEEKLAAPPADSDSDLVCDCICGAKMEPTLAKDAYKKCKFVYCDGCNAEFLNESIFHCPRGYDETHHSNGYDLCSQCAVVKAGEDQLKDAQIEQEEQKEAVVVAEPEPEPSPQPHPQAVVEEPAVREESPEIIVFDEEPQEIEDDHVEEQVDDEPEPEQPQEPEPDVFTFQAQLDQIKEIMNMNDNDDAIKILLVENNGDIQRVVPLLLQQ